MIASIKQFLEEKKVHIDLILLFQFLGGYFTSQIVAYYHQGRSHHSKCAPVDLVLFLFSEIGGSGPKGRHRHTPLGVHWHGQF